MLTILFKLFVTFFILTIIALLSIRVIGDLVEVGVIDDKHEEKIAKYTVSSLIGFGSLTALTLIIWVFGVVWLM